MWLFSVAYRYIKRLTTRECWVIWQGNKPCASCWCPSQSFIIIQSQKIKSYKSLVVNFTTINIHYDFNQKSNIHRSSINQNKFLKTKSNIHWITDPWKFELRYACIFCMKKSVQKYQCHTWDSLCQTPGQDWKSPQGQTAVNKKNKMQIQIIYNNTLDLELPLTII